MDLQRPWFNVYSYYTRERSPQGNMWRSESARELVTSCVLANPKGMIRNYIFSSPISQTNICLYMSVWWWEPIRASSWPINSANQIFTGWYHWWSTNQQLKEEVPRMICILFRGRQHSISIRIGSLTFPCFSSSCWYYLVQTVSGTKALVKSYMVCCPFLRF